MALRNAGRDDESHADTDGNEPNAKYRVEGFDCDAAEQIRQDRDADAGGNGDDTPHSQVQRVQRFILTRLGSHEALDQGRVQRLAALNGRAQRFQCDLALLVVGDDAGHGGNGEKGEHGDGDGEGSEMVHGGILVK